MSLTDLLLESLYSSNKNSIAWHAIYSNMLKGIQDIVR